MKSAKVAGAFEGDIRRNEMGIKAIDKDLLGEKEPQGDEAEISEEAEIKLDYTTTGEFIGWQLAGEESMPM